MCSICPTSRSRESRYGAYQVFRDRTSPITVLDGRHRDRRQRPQDGHGYAIWAKAYLLRQGFNWRKALG